MTNLFLRKDFKGALESFHKMLSHIKQMKDWQAAEAAYGRKYRTPQMPPHVAVLGHAIGAILGDSSEIRYDFEKQTETINSIFVVKEHIYQFLKLNLLFYQSLP